VKGRLGLSCTLLRYTHRVAISNSRLIEMN